MGSVFVALDDRLDREVALKVMRADLTRDDAFVARFRREARSAARLSHPHVVSVFDQGQDETYVFLAMELVRGRTLRDVIRSDAPLTARAALDILEPILQALAAAHQAGIVHRDVKPENVLIGEDGLVKVADFGLARAVTTETLTTNHDVLLGTAAYLSPEQVEHGTADKRSDVYSAGLLLFEMLTGAKAFPGESPIHVAYQHVHGTMPVPSQAISTIPRELDALVALAAAKSPDDRPSDAGETLTALRRTRSSLDEVSLDGRPTGSAASGGQGSSTMAFGNSSTSQFRRPPAPPQEKPRRVLRKASDGPTAPRPNGPPATNAPALSTGAPPPRSPQANRPGPSPAGPPRPPAGAGPRAGGAHPASRAVVRRRRGLLIGALIAALLIGGGSAWWFTAGPGGTVTVPNVAKQPKGQAVDAIKAAGLRPRLTEVFSEDVAKGTVVSTQPSGGADQRKSDSVVLRVSKGPQRFTVPQVVGVDQAAATATLKENSLVLGPVTQEFSETVETGKVIRSEPSTGDQVKQNAPVSLVISKGRQPIAVVDVSNQPFEAAQTTLTGLGLKVEKAPEAFHDTVPAGSVISQTPAPGTNLFKDDAVTLTVSKGPEMIPVPPVLNQTSGQAKSALETAGFTVKIDKVFGGLFDTVRGQNPPAGTKLRKGSTVAIQVV